MPLSFFVQLTAKVLRTYVIAASASVIVAPGLAARTPEMCSGGSEQR